MLTTVYQIASSLEKTFPGKHQYIFWNISSLFLRSVGSTDERTHSKAQLLTYYQISNDLPIEKRTLWGRLAFGQISKLAIATIQADVCIHFSPSLTDIDG